MSGVQSKLVEIPTLNRVEDYPGWQIQATHALKALKIWVYVSGKILELRGNKIPTAQQAMDDYLNEDQAKGVILSRLSPSLQRRVKDEIGEDFSSKKLWETIEKLCSSNKGYRKLHLLSKLLTPNLPDPFDHQVLISDMKTTNSLLEAIGIKMPDEVLPLLILRNLPREYNLLVRLLENRDMLTMSEVEDALDREQESILRARAEQQAAEPRANFGERRDLRGGGGSSNGNREHSRKQRGREEYPQHDRGSKRQRVDDKDKLICAFCERSNHSEHDCKFNPKAKGGAFKPFLAMHVMDSEPESVAAKKLKASGFKPAPNPFAGAALPQSFVESHVVAPKDEEVLEFDAEYADEWN
jgi:hypothetical protein